VTIRDVAYKREQLLARCAAQRDDLAMLAGQLSGPLKIADGAIAGVRYLRSHPLALGAVTALLAASRGRGVWTWARRGLLAWRAYRALRNK
jgi:hypothetical protein